MCKNLMVSGEPWMCAHGHALGVTRREVVREYGQTFRVDVLYKLRETPVMDFRGMEMILVPVYGSVMLAHIDVPESLDGLAEGVLLNKRLALKYMRAFLALGMREGERLMAAPIPGPSPISLKNAK